MTQPSGTQALVTPRDVAARLAIAVAEWDDTELGQIEALCDDVSELIRALRPKIDQWISDGLVRAGMVQAIATQVLVRALASVDRGGIPIVGESHPEFSVQYSQVAKAGLRLEPDELKMITPPGLDTDRGKAFSVQPVM